MSLFIPSPRVDTRVLEKIPVYYRDSIRTADYSSTSSVYALFWPRGDTNSGALVGFAEIHSHDDCKWISKIMPTRDKHRSAIIDSSSGGRSIRIRYAEIQNLDDKEEMFKHIDWISVRCIQAHDHDMLHRNLKMVKRVYGTDRLLISIDFYVRRRWIVVPLGIIAGVVALWKIWTTAREITQWIMTLMGP